MKERETFNLIDDNSKTEINGELNMKTVAKRKIVKENVKL